MATKGRTKASAPRKDASASTGPKGRTTRRARGSLSRKEILDGAQELVEAQGLQQLSMPALAKHLKSGVTSIYWYFRSKDDLLEALTERVTKEMYLKLPPIGDGAWDDELVDYFTAFRSLLERMPIYREVFAYRARLLFTRSAFAPAIFRRLDDGLSLFMRAGLSAEQAAEVFNACSNFTRGFVILEHGLESETVDPATTERLHHLDPSKFPTLGQFEDFERVMWLDDSQFQFGLRLLIAGIRQQYALH
ncbi:MAG TPA: TetR/AcrR family transcriptional regulator [Acidimicrobiales bacterium]|jgi:AcrR family transcriptional regulator